ncbi:hypothetical protein LR48_Vigan08g141600 [Vigna angularis]|uniref:Uncharacterized protein n=2 Tax=Phaseolus angularis TaxID=3914 RepID=A0A0L9V7E0_PHAAN|nr:uncharacterized protein LOC108339004 [Vigna angularis]XP_017431614.1 uncharacterized protein LOC108339004 [Vigna angularis]XP_052734355.1 uncharacterized protein LOC108339004 [Vigna angularis]BAT90455.1 hypothetical protein VIGAN_06170500 [Vigna angularis var. angularis]KAG2397479.1 uncharacterized protein HKW66_Vig0142850 [Vigna angularis]KOM50589.1 hypothetical protein LR48_Vigan08g141600 [Vigna angularis]
MSEQQLVDASLEMACRAAVVNRHLAYASDRGKLRLQLKESENKIAALTLKLGEETAAHSLSKQKHVETLTDLSRSGEELKEKNEELSKSNQEHVATIRSLKEDNHKLTDYGKHLETAFLNMKKEKDALNAQIQARDLQIKEMGKAIVEEHTLGFEKALRHIPLLLNVSTEGVGFDIMKDVYQGLVPMPIKNIPDELEIDDPAVPTKNVPEGATAPTEITPGETVDLGENSQEKAGAMVTGAMVTGAPPKEVEGSKEASHPSAEENANPPVNVID